MTDEIRMAEKKDEESYMVRMQVAIQLLQDQLLFIEELIEGEYRYDILSAEERAETAEAIETALVYLRKEQDRYLEEWVESYGKKSDGE